MDRVVSQRAVVWEQFRRRPVGLLGLGVLALFVLVGLYAPLLASSQPLFVVYDGRWYFPLLRYLFFRGFFTKPVDLFFNVAMFTVPVLVLSLLCLRGNLRRVALLAVSCAQVGFFAFLLISHPRDPAVDVALQKARQEVLRESRDADLTLVPSWQSDLQYLSPYGRLKKILRYKQRQEHHRVFAKRYGSLAALPTLWEMDRRALEEKRGRLQAQGAAGSAQLAYLDERLEWLQQESLKVSMMVMPFLRPFHWEDDAGGSRSSNSQLSFWDLTRVNRKDLVASLSFGVRVSLCVGLSAVSLSLLIAVPLGLLSGYYGGRVDMLLCRFIEVWESMPVFFTLLMIVAILQTKSIFVVIAVLGIFGWTGFVRYLRGEVLRERCRPYVEACRALGFSNRRIMFRHILPNAIPPVLTLLPFAIMAAITSEAGLSFLGLGEEGSSSWGVLMDEGRAAFPAESYLLWPPAILLTLLLMAIALVGDAMRDSLDPRMRR